MVQSQPKIIEVYCDGGSRGNPGPSSYGFVVKQKGNIIKQGLGYIGIETNNFAEYTALIEALNWLQTSFPGADLVAYLDSKLVVSQLSGLYKVKSSKIRDLVVKVRQLEPSFNKILYSHISRDKNKEADKLVNQALDNQEEYGS